MYLLNSSMTILSLTLWFLSWESTARLTSGLHGTRFYSPRLLILIFPYPLPFLTVLTNIIFLSFLFILSLSFSSLSLSLSHFLSVFLLQSKNESRGLKAAICAVVGWLRVDRGCVSRVERVNITSLSSAGWNYPH
jgi:hypothetical protein